jgi:predicted dehydrogenase
MTKPIRTGLASYGMSGLVFHAPLLHANAAFELHSVVERSYKGAAERYPGIRVLPSFESLLAQQDLELVIVNTPDTAHFDMAKKAILAGKHVVVEKPFTIHAAEADELMALARKQGVLLTVFQNRRWDGDYLTVKRIVEEKLLGRLVTYEGHFDRYRNYIQPNTWKEQHGPGAEILYNLGSHMIDQVYCLFDGMPQSVWADIGIQRSGGKAADFYHLVLHYPHVHVTLKASYLVREEGPRYILHGTEGSFLKWGIDPQEDELKKGKLPTGFEWGKEEEKHYGKLNTTVGGLHMTGRVETLPGNYNAFYDSLAQSIRTGTDLAVKPEEARNVIAIVEAAVESNEKKASVAIG